MSMNENTSITGNDNVIPLKPTRTAKARTIALVIVLALVSLAAASGIKPDFGGGGAKQTPLTTETAVTGPGAVYFPGQYVNQATEPSEHIQAF